MRAQPASWLARLAQRNGPTYSSIPGRRDVHASLLQREQSSIDRPVETRSNHESQLTRPPLSLLPLPSLLRSYTITALSSYPLLLSPSLRILSSLAHSSSTLLNPDRNPLLHFLLKKTFYAQFCAGETTQEVQETARGLKQLGFKGVILAYGKETVLTRGEKLAVTGGLNVRRDEKVIFEAEREVQAWKAGTIQTVEMTEPGDFVALKFSGAGRDVMRQLASNQPPSPSVEEATKEICDLAKSRGVRLLFDAEQNAVQHGIDEWTLYFQRRYNQGQAVVYGTYQAYLRSTPATVARHLVAAEKSGFVLGVKLVRGAYMSSDPRHLFWDTKTETDSAYNGISEALIKRQWNNVLQCPDDVSQISDVNLVLASHNQESVNKALDLRREQTVKGEKKIDMSYGQLMGMADEISCDLVLASKRNKAVNNSATGGNGGPNVYKYLVWGSVRECLKYLVRRAEENRDAVTRARGSRVALKSELLRRLSIWRS